VVSLELFREVAMLCHRREFRDQGHRSYHIKLLSDERFKSSATARLAHTRSAFGTGRKKRALRALFKLPGLSFILIILKAPDEHCSFVTGSQGGLHPPLASWPQAAS